MPHSRQSTTPHPHTTSSPPRPRRRWKTKTSSGRFSCSSRLSPPPFPASLSSASNGAASSATPNSSAASATTTGNLPSSASSWATPGTPTSGPISTLQTTSRTSASSLRTSSACTWTCSTAAMDASSSSTTQLREVMLFDPATGGRRHVVVPPVFDEKDIGVFNAAVICVAGDEGHVHGDCHTSPFQVVLIGIHDDNKRAFASVYSSETGTWGELISTAAIRYMCELSRPSTLVGDSVYWVFDGNEDGILKFDLDRHSLVNIEMPDLFRYYSCWSSFKIMSTDDGSFGLAVLEHQKFEMWERKVDCDGVAGWVLQKTFQLNTILGLGPIGGTDNLVLGYDEDDRAIYVRTDIGVCIIQLETMQFRNLGKDNFTTTAYYPYKSFYTAERGSSFN
uniref:F-box protein AT5G49610-like beta-propeller domain-containing protein n=1 Tax=Aegilops tauschii TaxID=37682 RepID=M8BBY4_AEGTA